MNMNKASLRIEKNPWNFYCFILFPYILYSPYIERQNSFVLKHQQSDIEWNDTTGLENVYTQYTSNYNSDEYI